jgi:8-hydroxy-5-deazaflavin:NADPH oxidoreductase
MRIGILGSGLMSAKLGTLFPRAGHDVVFSHARSDQKLKRLAREAGGSARAGTPADAARDADALVLAVHWLRIDDVLQQAGDLSRKIIVTCSLPMNAKDTDLVVAHTSSGAEELAKKVRSAKVVSAFGTLPTLIRDVGFVPADAGVLRVIRYLEPFALVMGELAYDGEGGPELAYRFERSVKDGARQPCSSSHDATSRGSQPGRQRCHSLPRRTNLRGSARAADWRRRASTLRIASSTASKSLPTSSARKRSTK